MIILGASARAAAASALRAGITPICADLFADLDLARLCEVVRVPGASYPACLEAAARGFPPGPWMYTGALENHPDLVGRIAASRPLWGNGPEILRRVRDPFAVAACLKRAGLPHPPVRQTSHGLPRDGSWLVKPLAGAGGRGVRELVREDETSADRSQSVAGAVARQSTPYSVLSTQSLADDCHAATSRFAQSTDRRAAAIYFQERIDGVSCAAVFVADGRHATLLGVTEQLVGEPAFHAKPFRYCGSIGPLRLEGPAHESCAAVGGVLTAEFGLVGLFGVDGVCSGETFWPVEVNPRYTASVEILEHTLGACAIELHRAACGGGRNREPARPVPTSRPERRGTVLGKAVLFAPTEFVALDLTERMLDVIKWDGPWSVPRIADVPRPGTRIQRGSPVLTLFAAGESRAACRAALAAEAAAWYELLH